MSEKKPLPFSKKTPARPAVPVLLDFLQMLVVLDSQRRLSVFVEWKTF